MAIFLTSVCFWQGRIGKTYSPMVTGFFDKTNEFLGSLLNIESYENYTQKLI